MSNNYEEYLDFLRKLELKCKHDSNEMLSNKNLTPSDKMHEYDFFKGAIWAIKMAEKELLGFAYEER